MAEMLIVVTVIGTLTLIGLNSYQGILRRGRDQRRQADLAQIQLALEQYKSNHFAGAYPNSTGGEAPLSSATFNVLLIPPPYLPEIPVDPQPDSSAYYYQTYDRDGVEYYQICARLEDGGNPSVIDPENCIGHSWCSDPPGAICNYRVHGP